MAATRLLTMPLHAITEVYGESGLRARFLLEMAAVPPPARADVLRAQELATRLHRHDRRILEPYVNHVLRVAIRIVRYYGVSDPDVIAAALLHDAVEDHPVELAGLPPDTSAEAATDAALATLADDFNPRVAALVAAVTNAPYEPGLDRHQQYRDHVTNSLDRDPWARVIKVSDFTDNGIGIHHLPPPKAASSAAKYFPLVPAYRELIARPDTPLSAAAKRHIYGQLDQAERRFAAILDGPPDQSAPS